MLGRAIGHRAVGCEPGERVVELELEIFVEVPVRTHRDLARALDGPIRAVYASGKGVRVDAHLGVAALELERTPRALRRIERLDRLDALVGRFVAGGGGDAARELPRAVLEQRRRTHQRDGLAVTH